MEIRLEGNLTSVKDILAIAGFNANGEAEMPEKLTARMKLAMLAVDEEGVKIDSVVLIEKSNDFSALHVARIVAFMDKYWPTICKAFRQQNAEWDARWVKVWSLLKLEKDTPVADIEPLLEMTGCPAFQIYPDRVIWTLNGLKMEEIIHARDFFKGMIEHIKVKAVRFGREAVENEAFAFRTLCNTIGLSGEAYGDMRKWALKPLDGNSAWRYKE